MTKQKKKKLKKNNTQIKEEYY